MSDYIDEPGRDERIVAVLREGLDDLVEWRLTDPNNGRALRRAEDRLYNRLARLPYPDLLRAAVLLLLETEEYAVRVNAGLELASTVTVPEGWQS